MLKKYPEIVQLLKSGEEYAIQTSEQRFEYIEKIVGMLGSLPKFELSIKIGSKKNAVWQNVLRWWMNPSFGIVPKTPDEISDWYEYAYHNFVYMFNWGLGSIIGLVGDVEVQGLFQPSLEYWPLMQLPWIVFWIKDLIIWGTLDPVAAYLLSSGKKGTRKEAEDAAESYYEERALAIADELLNPQTIRNWADLKFGQYHQEHVSKPLEFIKVDLLRNFDKVINKQWRVIPVELDTDVFWFDPAGFPLAKCQMPKHWESSYLTKYDFQLNSASGIVSSTSYF
jgi:hypothetical protein